MKRLFLTIAVVLSLTGCQKLPTPICYGEAIIGGQETVIPIYAVKKVNDYTLYKAGSIYNWRVMTPTY